MAITLNYQPANDWSLVATPDGNGFSFAFASAVRLSQGQNWVESKATFVTADGTNPWRDATGAALTTVNGANQWGGLAAMRSSNFMVVNATSELWGMADKYGGFDEYGYNILRPWKLDDSVAWAALKNPDAVGFQFVEDMAKDGTGGHVGTIYSHRFGFPEAQPNMTVTFDPGSSPHSYSRVDFNHDCFVSFKDYIILEGNFGKTHATNAMGDANGDGVVDFKDYVCLEGGWFPPDPRPLPEPASIGLLIAGGLTLLRRRA